MSYNIRLFFLLIIFRLSLVYWLNPFPLTNFKLFPQDYCLRQYLFSPARRTSQIVEKSDFMRRILTKSRSWNDPLLWYNSLFALNTFFIVSILSYGQSRIWMFGRALCLWRYFCVTLNLLDEFHLITIHTSVLDPHKTIYINVKL